MFFFFVSFFCVQGNCSVHHILSDHCHSALRDTIPSGGSAVGGVRAASPAVSGPFTCRAHEFLQEATVSIRPHPVVKDCILLILLKIATVSRAPSICQLWFSLLRRFLYYDVNCRKVL